VAKICQTPQGSAHRKEKATALDCASNKLQRARTACQEFAGVQTGQDAHCQTGTFACINEGETCKRVASILFEDHDRCETRAPTNQAPVSDCSTPSDQDDATTSILILEFVSQVVEEA